MNTKQLYREAGPAVVAKVQAPRAAVGRFAHLKNDAAGLEAWASAYRAERRAAAAPRLWDAAMSGKGPS